jgi:hypothetical protein
MKSTTTLVSLLAVSLPLLANAQVSWVSGVGDDANPGTRTAPCKTFAGAIAKTAAGGVINVLDPGGFGGLTITKAITIDGMAAEGGVLVSGTPGFTIAAGPTDTVNIRNMSFDGLNTGTVGIRILSAGTVHIENCRISGFVSDGINDGNSVSNAALFIKDVTIRTCTPAGISLAPTAPDTVTIQNVNITGCGDGIDVITNSTAVVTKSTVSGNTGAGIQSLGGLIELSGSTITGNGGQGLEFTKPGQIVSYRNNLVVGNNPDGKASSTTTVK